MEAHYYIAKGRKTVGPCTLDDLQGYIAYGSVGEDDLVRCEGSSEWVPLKQMEELRADLEDPSATAREITSRRRTARYRNYEHVPQQSRSGQVLSRLIWGFLLFPPLLWRGASSIYQGRVYSRKADAKGYLLRWPRWVEPVVSVMLVVNCLAWALLCWWAWNSSAPLINAFGQSLREGLGGLFE